MIDFPSPEHVLAFGRRANELLEIHKALPTPENYELWFAYAAQRNEALTAALDDAVKCGRVCDLNHSRVLHARFFGQGSSETIEEIGNQLTDELQKLTDSIEESSTHTAAYDKTLTHAGAELEKGTPDIKSIVQRLSAATRAVQLRNKGLEEQLQNSAKEVDGLRTRMETVRKESLTDALTGLANRRSFDEVAQKGVDDALRENKPLSLIISDIDHFKKFNDTYGHPIGDQVLRLVAQCLKTNVKGKDLAARFGGEEFVVILPGTSLQNALAVATDIRKSVETKKIVQKSSGKDMGTVTLSLGVAQFVPGEQVADLLNRADACLYAAKRQGRNRVVTEHDLGGNPQAQADTTGGAPAERSEESKRFEYAVRAICRDGAMPLRSNIDLRQFHRFARWMVIAEPEIDQKKIPMRLVGSGFQDLLGRELRGMDYLEFVDPDICGAVYDNAIAMTKLPCALWQKTPSILPDGQSVLFEYTVFPMLDEKANKHQLLILVNHELTEGRSLGGVPEFKHATIFKWLDLGEGIPSLNKSAAA